VVSGVVGAVVAFTLLGPVEAPSLPPPQAARVHRISANKKRRSDFMELLINEFIAV
jgi:hypothetical protein